MSSTRRGLGWRGATGSQRSSAAVSAWEREGAQERCGHDGGNEGRGREKEDGEGAGACGFAREEWDGEHQGRMQD